MAHGRRTRQEGQRDQRERRILALLAETVDPGFTHRELAPRVGAATSTVYQDLDGINPSDLLIVRPQPPRHLRDGEVVVAVRDQDTDSAGLVLKR